MNLTALNADVAGQVIAVWRFQFNSVSAGGAEFHQLHSIRGMGRIVRGKSSDSERIPSIRGVVRRLDLLSKIGEYSAAVSV
jgi:hypothetical protein